MENKKGLSTVVTTLIIILLVLVAIGVVWTVVRSLIGNTGDTVNYANKCIGLAFTGIGTGIETGTVTRAEGSSGNEITGVYVNNVQQPGNIVNTKDVTGLTGVIEGAVLTVKPYFEKEDGTNYICG